MAGKQYKCNSGSKARDPLYCANKVPMATEGHVDLVRMLNGPSALLRLWISLIQNLRIPLSSGLWIPGDDCRIL
jgi:hypothetical protein